MKLWEIQRESLRLMFADSDINFSEDDFKDGIVDQNDNTREKLVLMNSSIRRAIDMFYQFNGQLSQMTTIGLDFTWEDENGDPIVPGDGDDTSLYTKIYTNSIDVSEISNFGYPTRFDIIQNADEGISENLKYDFNFDIVNGNVFFDYSGIVDMGEGLVFKMYFKMDRLNIPADDLVDRMTYDLNLLYIPVNVQRQIPLFVKGELYEEDEPGMAQAANQTYAQFLLNNRRKSSFKTKTKVVQAYPRSTS